MKEGGVVELGSATVKPLPRASGQIASPIGDPLVGADRGR